MSDRKNEVTPTIYLSRTRARVREIPSPATTIKLREESLNQIHLLAGLFAGYISLSLSFSLSLSLSLSRLALYDLFEGQTC